LIGLQEEQLLTFSEDFIVSFNCFVKSSVKLLEFLLAFLRLNEVVEQDLFVDFEKSMFVPLKQDLLNLVHVCCPVLALT
jgi:hypothetical protein